jgi:hypothetical protein
MQQIVCSMVALVSSDFRKQNVTTRGPGCDQHVLKMLFQAQMLQF